MRSCQGTEEMEHSDTLDTIPPQSQGLRRDGELLIYGSIVGHWLSM